MSCVAIAAQLGCSQSRVRAALHREGIALRPGGLRVPVLEVDAETLRRLYVDDGLDDTAIGRRYGVPAHRVLQRRRELVVIRPPAAPPHPDPPTPPPTYDLECRYVREGATLEQIAREHHTSSAMVHRWLVATGIPVRPRTRRVHRKALDLGRLRQMYVIDEWTATALAAELDTTVHVVLRTLHDNGIPVRPGGGRRQFDVDDTDRLLDRLYADPDVDALLHRYKIPSRRRTGSIAERFPRPVAAIEPMLRQAYLDLGLSARHIELLTGQPAGQILDALHAYGIPVRGPGLSPWLRRQQRTQPKIRRRPS